MGIVSAVEEIDLYLNLCNFFRLSDLTSEPYSPSVNNSSSAHEIKALAMAISVGITIAGF